jgi:SpoVK/Ycf46/Vps4 family AAA+-type ATPase
MAGNIRDIAFYYLGNILSSPSASGSIDRISSRWARYYADDFFDPSFGDSYALAMAEFSEKARSSSSAQWLDCYRSKKLLQIKTRLFKIELDRVGAPKSLDGFKEVLKADRIADCFKLNAAEREVLRLLCLTQEHQCLNELYSDSVGNSYSVEVFKGNTSAKLGHLMNLSAIEVEKAFRPGGPLVSNGLIKVERESEFLTSWPLKKMLQSPNDGADLRATILTKMDQAELIGADFDFLGENYVYLFNLLKNALAKKARGVNVLLYGQPGTGKTELAKTLCSHIGADLYSCSDIAEREDDQDKWDVRLEETLMAMALLAGDRNSVLLFDEAEDVFNKGSQKDISKMFVNRLLEDNATPVIWTTNGIEEIDPAHLRRFSFALELRTPPFGARFRVWSTELQKNGLNLSQAEIAEIARDYELPPSFTSSAVRAAVLTDDSRAIRKTINGLEAAVNGCPKPLAPGNGKKKFDTALLRVDLDLVRLSVRLKSLRVKNFSMCLYGPPGTGKSEYATNLAKYLDMTILRRKASDLKSKWLGETEFKIAEAFREAAYGNYFLIFDEADSFLYNREKAERSWEVTEVNEMLAQMENHPLPFICATNLYETLDKASLRRFTFKVRFGYLDRPRVIKAFAHFFGFEHDPNLNNLTPGDFAQAARQAKIIGLSTPEEISQLLAQESALKGKKSNRIGF